MRIGTFLRRSRLVETRLHGTIDQRPAPQADSAGTELRKIRCRHGSQPSIAERPRTRHPPRQLIHIDSDDDMSGAGEKMKLTVPAVRRSRSIGYRRTPRACCNRLRGLVVGNSLGPSKARSLSASTADISDNAGCAPFRPRQPSSPSPPRALHALPTIATTRRAQAGRVAVTRAQAGYGV